MHRLSVIVPVYNEESHLRQLIETFMNSPCPIEREWIFVDDSSTDKSLEIMKDLKNRYHFQLLEQKANQGKGAAVIRGIEIASGDFIMIQDADFENDPNDIPALLAPLLDLKADVVYGSRFKKDKRQVQRTYHYLTNRILTFLSNIMSGIYLSDMASCYKVFRSDILKSMNLRSKKFGIEIEITAFLAKTNSRIYEIPISYFPRTRQQGKKICWKDGIAAFFHIIRFNCFTSSHEAFKK
jgi:glycosyltransferase involved in cell wall biosynthesis